MSTLNVFRKKSLLELKDFQNNIEVLLTMEELTEVMPQLMGLEFWIKI